jgi:Bifunctional DNA primase/polymerase, N-terminal
MTRSRYGRCRPVECWPVPQAPRRSGDRTSTEASPRTTASPVLSLRARRAPAHDSSVADERAPTRDDGRPTDRAADRPHRPRRYSSDVCIRTSKTALAIRYIDRGVPALPVALRWESEAGHVVKRPLLGAGGFRNAARNAGQARKLFRDIRHVDEPVGRGNELGTDELVVVGLWLGPARMFILDVDIKNDQHGDDELDALEGRHGKLPETVRTVSVSGGAGIWFRKPDGLTIDNTTLAPGVDVRGDNGFVVAPGQSTPWGEWAFDGPSFLEGGEVAPSPQWVCRCLAERASSNGTRVAKPAADIDLGALLPQVRRMLDERVEVGKRSKRTYAFVCVALTAGLDEPTVLAALTHYPPAVDRGDVVRHGQLAIGHARANGVSP